MCLLACMLACLLSCLQLQKANKAEFAALVADKNELLTELEASKLKVKQLEEKVRVRLCARACFRCLGLLCLRGMRSHLRVRFGNRR